MGCKTGGFASKNSHKSRSVLEHGSVPLGLMLKGKNRIDATDLYIRRFFMGKGVGDGGGGLADGQSCFTDKYVMHSRQEKYAVRL